MFGERHFEQQFGQHPVEQPKPEDKKVPEDNKESEKLKFDDTETITEIVAEKEETKEIKEVVEEPKNWLRETGNVLKTLWEGVLPGKEEGIWPTLEKIAGLSGIYNLAVASKLISHDIMQRAAEQGTTVPTEVLLITAGMMGITVGGMGMYRTIINKRWNREIGEKQEGEGKEQSYQPYKYKTWEETSRELKEREPAILRETTIAQIKSHLERGYADIVKSEVQDSLKEGSITETDLEQIFIPLIQKKVAEYAHNRDGWHFVRLLVDFGNFSQKDPEIQKIQEKREQRFKKRFKKGIDKEIYPMVKKLGSAVESMEGLSQEDLHSPEIQNEIKERLMKMIRLGEFERFVVYRGQWESAGIIKEGTSKEI